MLKKDEGLVDRTKEQNIQSKLTASRTIDYMSKPMENVKNRYGKIPFGGFMNF